MSKFNKFTLNEVLIESAEQMEVEFIRQGLPGKERDYLRCISRGEYPKPEEPEETAD